MAQQGRGGTKPRDIYGKHAKESVRSGHACRSANNVVRCQAATRYAPSHYRKIILYLARQVQCGYSS